MSAFETVSEQLKKTWVPLVKDYGDLEALLGSEPPELRAKIPVSEAGSILFSLSSITLELAKEVDRLRDDIERLRSE